MAHLALGSIEGIAKLLLGFVERLDDLAVELAQPAAHTIIPSPSGFPGCRLSRKWCETPIFRSFCDTRRAKAVERRNRVSRKINGLEFQCGIAERCISSPNNRPQTSSAIIWARKLSRTIRAIPCQRRSPSPARGRTRESPAALAFSGETPGTPRFGLNQVSVILGEETVAADKA